MTNLELHEPRQFDGLREKIGCMHQPLIQRLIVDAEDDVSDKDPGELGGAGETSGQLADVLACHEAGRSQE